MKRAAIYARVSTKFNGQNPETQLIALREYVRSRGWEIAGEYVDHGVSGRQGQEAAAGQAHERRQGQEAGYRDLRQI